MMYALLRWLAEIPHVRLALCLSISQKLKYAIGNSGACWEAESQRQAPNLLIVPHDPGAACSAVLSGCFADAVLHLPFLLVYDCT